LIPARTANDAAGTESRKPRARDKNAIAMVGRARVPHPSQRLSQRTSGMLCLPATDQAEFVGQAIEQITFAPQYSDCLAGLPISHCNVEVAGQYQVGAAAKKGNAVENLMYRADVAAFAGRPVNAERHQRTLRPRGVPDFAADHPAVVIRNHDGDQGSRSCKQSASPTSASGGLPCKCIVLIMPEPFTRRIVWGTTFLRHYQIRL